MSLNIAIVGAGFSGLAIALHLRQKSSAHHIILCDGAKQLAKGIAYSTQNPSHLLNVPAGNMSALADKPNHFVDWLIEHYPHLRTTNNLADQFVPRCYYGEYLSELLNELQKTPNQQLTLAPSQVVAVEKKQPGFWLTLANGKQFFADAVVLAFGLALPPTINNIRQHQHLIQNPWDFSLLKSIEKNADVCIIGTGLTMIDTVLTLEDQHHHGKIYAVSRHGLLPQAHRPFNKAYTLHHKELPQNLTDLVRYIRKAIVNVKKDNDNWRSVIDGLRPYTSKIWQDFSITDKKKFLQHLVAYWDTHRHRIAEAVFNRIQRLRETGQLTIIAGRIVDAQQDKIMIHRRAQEEHYMITTKWLINCSGPNTNFNKIQDALINSLIQNKLIQPDRLGLGIRVDDKCNVINERNEVESHLMALGNMCKGTFWESTAVPEIRKQAKMIAHSILTT